MRIDGSYTFNAPRDLVWSLLHDFPVIQQSIPGCEHFYLHADGKYHISLRQPAGPFRGTYEGLVTRIEEQPQDSIHLSLSGSGPELVFFGEGILKLNENAEQTVLVYEGDVEISGQIPARSPRLTRTTANFLLRSFLESLDQQIKQSAGYTESKDLPHTAAAVAGRTTPTISMQDFLAEIRRDRWVAVTVLTLILFAILSFLGAVFLGILFVRWLTRSYAGRLGQPRTGEFGNKVDAIEG